MSTPTVNLRLGDCRKVLDEQPENSADSVVCDPPYELKFMGSRWDSSGVAFDPATWRAALRVLKPGGHLLAFGGTRTHHRMVCAIEDAGFEIRDMLMCVYGSGFPKSLDVSKAIDKTLGATRDAITAPATPEAQQWANWGTALKPSYEPVILARKPLDGTVAGNVLAHGVGGINIDASRVEAKGRPLIESQSDASVNAFGNGLNGSRSIGTTDQGRWPANLLHDGSDEVLAAFPQTGSGFVPKSRRIDNDRTA